MRDSKLRTIVLVVLAVIGGGCDEIFESSEIDRLSVQLDGTITSAVGPDGRAQLLLPPSDELGSIPSDRGNPITEEKVRLGRYLFHETALAAHPVLQRGQEQYSCASCHHSRAGFQSGLKQGLAEGGIGFGLRGEERRRDLAYNPEQIRTDPIRPQATLNTAWTESAGWTGVYGDTPENRGTEEKWNVVVAARLNTLGYSGVETRSIAAFERYGLDPTVLKGHREYEELFGEAFPGLPADEVISRTTAGLAIAAYLRTITASRAPFQQWLRGRRLSMGTSELEGAILFFGKARCYTCHEGPSLGSQGYHALGMSDLSGARVVSAASEIDSVGRGRETFTGDPADRYAFRTPQLYNLADAAFFGHGSSFRSLGQVVRYKNKATPQNPRVDADALADGFIPLELTRDEMSHLEAFLSEALRDPDLRRYEPDSLPSGNCFPNADIETRRDLACR
jgi:cytochrome c peroxidase